MDRSGAPTYTKNSKTQRISATLFQWCPIFIFYQTFSVKPVVPLAGPWSLPLTGAPARPVVLLAGLWWP